MRPSGGYQAMFKLGAALRVWPHIAQLRNVMLSNLAQAFQAR
jgi:hypothetical protein